MKEYLRPPINIFKEDNPGHNWEYIPIPKSGKFKICNLEKFSVCGFLKTLNTVVVPESSVVS